MFPSALAEQLEAGMGEFLKTSFWSSTPGFDSLIGRFLENRETLYRGPFVSLDLPFKASAQSGSGFSKVPLKHRPHAHQELAFRRIFAGQNTIVATGTGSGKTECFAIPILAHCAERLSERGIKAIILYPMNALAADQALRLAQLVHGNDTLRGQLNIGMFVGEQESAPHTTMGENHVITDKETLRRNPPDILLTNYKMLDYLLLRPDDQPLWQHNDPETLRYLVVDELHTFDGAQGTDLACLIRRLKARLRLPAGHLCGVGTSATLGNDTAASEGLLRYAMDVFAEPFERQAIIGETRLSSTEFLENELISMDFSTPNTFEVLSPSNYPTQEAYIRGQTLAWFSEDVPAEDILSRLKPNVYFQNLIKVTRAKELMSVDLIAEKIFPKSTHADIRRLQVISLLALVSHARVSGGPAVQVRLQMWQREMRRMVASVGATPELRFHDDLNEKQSRRHLPVVFCRDCGLMGWATLTSNSSPSRYSCDLQPFYEAYFKRDVRVKFLFPKGLQLRGAQPYWLHVDEMQRQQIRPDDVAGFFEIDEARNQTQDKGRLVLSLDCPQCGDENGLSLLGFQAASLASTFVSQLFTTSYNDDRRLMTFSDSVQDAAHRAGFYGARSWGFNLRVAISRYLREEGDGQDLARVALDMPRWWRSELGDEEFVATFIPTSLEWRDDYEVLRTKGKLPKGSDLPDMVERRMAWETIAEFTYRSPIGRTLRRAGTAVAGVDPARLDQAAVAFERALSEQFRVTVDRSLATSMLVGMLARMRDRGAILHDAIPHDYLKTLGNNDFVFGRLAHIYLPKVGGASRLPCPITDAQSKRFDRAFGTAQSPSWYARWFSERLSNTFALSSAFGADAVRVALTVLEDAQIVATRRFDAAQVWGIRPDALVVSSEVQTLRTQNKQIVTNFAAWEASLLEGQPGFLVDDAGNFERFEAPANFYAGLFRTGTVHRVNASEHTGLLTRDVREGIETSFKNEPQRAWDINLLSCTPTLEMGIDVGALSTVMLCSVPPTVANYVQRIGRAGRRDGNSLVATIANASPHDLYFFEAPGEMIRGQVSTPGVFLNASAVLQRQLFAFCLDRWVSRENITRKQFPKRVQEILPALDGTPNLDRFPHNFGEYVTSHQTELARDFLAMFPDIETSTADALKKFISGVQATDGAMLFRLLNALIGLRNERLARRSEISTLDSRVKALEALPTRSPAEIEELRELHRERSALKRLVQSLNEKDTLQVLADDGLTPNYAFPEAGVSLKSIIWKENQQVEEDGGPSQHLEFTYERSARSAIVELAPNAKFYAGGRRVQVNQVDIKKSVPEPWRFCPVCTYARSVAGDDTFKNCPSCQSPGWADVGQRRTMLKLTQVFAWTKDSDSRIGDEREDREPSFFNREMLVHFGDTTSSNAWHLAEEDTPFGAEFVPLATFREINFGDAAHEGTQLAIAGRESVRTGFTVCSSCGRVQGVKKHYHSASCRYRHETESAKYETALYLYREFRSEAVRFLLPFMDEPGFSQKLHSFVAALEMGLKKYFGGRIDHLEATLYNEPIADESHRKQFLVLYDTVPGGTGYLKELVRDEHRIFDILQGAMDTLQTCACQTHPEQDGCYRCLYAYRRARVMDDTSRTTALEALGKILQKRDKWRPIESLGRVDVSALLESLLEQRFLEALNVRFEGTLTRATVRGKPGYSLRIGDYSWAIEPQVELGAKDGVVRNCRADMVLWPQRENEGVRPIVVFTDGFAYHKNRLHVDFEQRMALYHSGRFWTWSLTWEDIEAALNRREPADEIDLLRAEGIPPEKLREGFRKWTGSSWNFENGSFELLVKLLETRDAESFSKALFISGAAMVSSRVPEAKQWLGAMGDWVVPNARDAMEEFVSGAMLVKAEWPATRGPGEYPEVWLFGAMTPGREMAATLVLDDTPLRRDASAFKRQWRAVIWALNRLQFGRLSFVLPTEFQADMKIGALIQQMTLPTALKTDETRPWDEVVKSASVVEPAYGEVMGRLREAGLPAPVAGFELCAGKRVVATGEAAWVDQRVVLVAAASLDPDGYDESMRGFAGAGWLVFDILEVELDELTEVLGGVR